MAVITAKSENTKPATKVRYYYRTNIHVWQEGNISCISIK
jgi:hypothetical protein